ncbi:MAG: hypothetical protein EBZ91_05580 [Gammaproteobacteria bacterium]|nr:hypothetical protein [Gammaproteobacteria bacterium]
MSTVSRFSSSTILLVLLPIFGGCGGGGGSSQAGTTPSTPAGATVPTAPTISAVQAADSAANFTVATTATGVTVYAVTCSAGNVTRSGSANTSSVRVTGLTNGTAYACTSTVTNSAGTSTASAAVSVTPVGATSNAFRGDVILGSPTDNSIKINVFATNQSGSVSLAYGTVSGQLDKQTPSAVLQAGKPQEFTLANLSANTRYFYRLQFTATDGSASGSMDEATFHTARPAGSTFVFAIQGDSHPERERTTFNADLYRRTLNAAAADQPDFYILMGDDFSIDQYDPTNITQSLVESRYTLQRPYLGIIGKRAPLFLLNGNHEQAARYLLDGTPNNPAVWAQNSRNALFSQPAPDNFYSGNAEQVTHIGLLRNYFSWTWGDALFVVIDPYWASPVAVDNIFGSTTKRANLWDVTHGDAQYLWLKNTLEKSTAKYKFVFAHHVMGTGRGGIELAGLYEWGGKNPNGTTEFSVRRPTWTAPIHQLMAANKVKIFFQGHDHIWVRQQLDGVTYQTLPQPADPNYAFDNEDAYQSGDKLPNSGYARVTVSPNGVKVEYVRMYLPADEGPGKTSGTVAYSYTVQ